MLKNLVLANISNGLVYPHDGVCYFQSNHAHNYSFGYFDDNAIGLDYIIHLLEGGELTLVDGTQKINKMPDAFKFGVPTWCCVFNRACWRAGNTVESCWQDFRVCEWQTPEMIKAASGSRHRKLVNTIRKLSKIYGSNPIAISNNIFLRWYGSIDYDDKPDKIRDIIKSKQGPCSLPT